MKTNPNLLTYFLTNSLFLGGGLSMIFKLTSHDTYISAIFGTIIGVFIIYILNKVNNNEKNTIFKIIYFLYIISFLFILLIDLSTFLYSYFLPYTPSFLSCLPFIFLATFMNSKSIKHIYYIAIALFPISIFIIILKNLLLIGNISFNNLLPVFISNSRNMFYASIIYGVLSTIPYMLLLNEKIDFKKSIKYYLLANICNLIVIIVCIGSLGVMVNTYSYPEYSVLRKIKIYDFIENIENFISVSWLFDIFITLSLSSIKIKEIFNTQKRFIPFTITTIILYLVYKIISNNYYNSIFIYNYYIYLFIGFILLIPIILFFNKKRITK